MEPLTWGLLAAALGLGALGAMLYMMQRQVRRAAQIRSALDDSEIRLAGVVDSAMDAIITIDERQRVVQFNRAAESVFRCRRADALGGPLERFIPARFRAGHRQHVETFGNSGASTRRMGDDTVLWGLRADGEEFPLEASISQAGEPGRRYYTVILRDVTQRQRNLETLRRQQQELRDLAARVLEVREEEKTAIARELHDELGQLLTALKMDLAWLRERLPASELGRKAAQMDATLDTTVAATRRIAAELRPLMLDDLGLPAAAEWLVGEFGERSGTDCRLELSAREALEEIDPDVATALYRALQESLTNVARHAKARRAWIVLGAEDATATLEVEDDGCGLPADALGAKRSLGLKGMRERVSYLGGTFEIGVAPRGGTRVRVRLPLAARAKAAA